LWTFDLNKSFHLVLSELGSTPYALIDDHFVQSPRLEVLWIS